MINSKIRILLSTSFDPWFNLATEDWLYRNFDRDAQLLFLWRNQPTVVIGRSQNPWLECQLDKMTADDVLLTRRHSGGGAVFHDLGTTIFSFLSNKQHYDKKANLAILTRALAQLGIPAMASGRNDIVIDIGDQVKKISGSAFKENQQRALHHGTILVNTDLDRLQEYLNPHPKKITAKGITSVRSRVANLTELQANLDHDQLIASIMTEFCQHYGQVCAPELLNHTELMAIAELREYYEQLKSWQWRFGNTLEFTHQLEEYFAWGLIDLRLQVIEGCIINAQIFSDSLIPEVLEHLAAILQNTPYEAKAVQKQLAELIDEHPNQQLELQQLSDWLTNNI